MLIFLSKQIQHMLDVSAFNTLNRKEFSVKSGEHHYFNYG